MTAILAGAQANAVSVNFIPLRAPIKQQTATKKVVRHQPAKADSARQQKATPLPHQQAQSTSTPSDQPAKQSALHPVQHDAKLRKNYLSELLTHIESYKYYPQVAQRRGISGQVRISFNLLADGRVVDLAATNGPLLLCHAAQTAVQQAVPLPVPPKEMELPMQVSFTMQYQLQ